MLLHAVLHHLRPVANLPQVPVHPPHHLESAVPELPGDRVLRNRTAADEWESQLRSTQAYGQWVRGNPEEAARALEFVRPLRWSERMWWLARMYLELGRPADAARWLQALIAGNNVIWPHAAPLLGRAYKEMGELEKAQEAYAEYLDIWRDADPELEPLKDQARVRREAIQTERP